MYDINTDFKIKYNAEIMHVHEYITCNVYYNVHVTLP